MFSYFCNFYNILLSNLVYLPYLSHLLQIIKIIPFINDDKIEDKNYKIKKF